MTPGLTFAIGDIHGCFGKLEELMQSCADYAGQRPFRYLMLGDYVDRGPDSSKAVRRLRLLTERSPNTIVCLKGNHEAMLLSAIENPAKLPRWTPTTAVKQPSKATASES